MRQIQGKASVVYAQLWLNCSPARTTSGLLMTPSAWLRPPLLPDDARNPLLSKQMVTDSGRGEAAEWRPHTIRSWVGAGDESRTRDPLLGKHRVPGRIWPNC